MGYIKHHTIIVTTYGEYVETAHDKAIELFDGLTSNIVKGKINGYSSFFIAPDGSKEGWDESNKFDELRKTFIDWVNEQAYEDGSNSIAFAEIFYGEDNGYCKIENHN